MADSRRGGRRGIGGVLGACASSCSPGATPDEFRRAGEPPAATIAPPALPGKAGAHRVSQFVFYSDTPLKPNAPLFAELVSSGDQMFHELQLPPSNTVVQVYLFDDQDRYEPFMRYRYPELPKRRAFFVAHPGTPGGPRELLVFTYWGDHLRQDLRHELTHALLNSVLKEVPLWLDEGLAEDLRAAAGAGRDERPARGRRSAHARWPRPGGPRKARPGPQMGRPSIRSPGPGSTSCSAVRRRPQVLLPHLQHLRDPDPPGRSCPGSGPSTRTRGPPLLQHLALPIPPAASLAPVRPTAAIPYECREALMANILPAPPARWPPSKPRDLV